MPVTYALPLTTTGTVAATATTPGTNKLNWAVPPTTGAGDPQTFAWRALFLQRSIDPRDATNAALGGLTVFNHVITISALLVRQVPRINARWRTIKSWTTAELPNGSWPLTYSDPVPHSTLYYYRLVYMARANADGTGSGIQYEWNPATIVQPGVLQMGSAACGTTNGTRLCWDAPPLFAADFNFTVVREGTNWALRWTWPFQALPTSYVLFKSTDNEANYFNVATIANNFAQPFTDSDTRSPMFYKLVAHTADGAVSTYDIRRVVLP